MIKVESAAFNYNDLWAVWGEPIKIPLPHISGTDIAGTVTDIGSGVTTIKVGDRVVSHANLSCRTCYLCMCPYKEIVADYVVNQRDADWYKTVRTITKKSISGEGVDIIFEHIGESVFAKAVSLIKMGGTLVSTGATTGYNTNLDLRYLFFRGINLIGSTQGTRAELEDVIYWTSKGNIRPVIDTVLPFSRITEGYAKMASGNHFGKILLTPQIL